MSDGDSDELVELCDQVIDETTFLRFLAALAADRLDEVRREKDTPSSPWGPGANGWENATIEAFLESAAAWGRSSSDGLQFYSVPDNPWRRCADILYMGKLYE